MKYVFYLIRKSFILRLVSFSFLLLSNKVMALEAFSIEGLLGTNISTITDQTNASNSISGTVQIYRFLIPISQSLKHEWDLSTSYQLFDGSGLNNSNNQRDYWTYSGFGLGASYKYLSLFYFGAEYSSNQFRLITLGSTNTSNQFTNSGIRYFVGLQKKFGTLGLGVVYSAMSSQFSASNTGFGGGQNYNDSAVLFSISYHFDGSTRSFLKGLYSNPQGN